ncbi:TrkH family potassium uptake protein [Egicoccus halophilus]|uniref:Potassium transporter n=1 Tax=Egicoccus halophilus TaxID=1670830 RepID=A0A8J3AAN3_9ACTN|nr:potassium transporter TrkG [Egicoccus halophilus]GGI08937.1 potassium transporter [Egicoccus halophilus]
MLLRPGADDLRLIGYYLGKVLLGLGLVMAGAAVVAAALAEWNTLSAFVIGASLCGIVGGASEAKLATRQQLTWAHGMVTVALAWLVGAIFAAVPFHLSGHYEDWLSAVFEGMSALTTTGLSVVSDLDHTTLSMDFYRHLLHFAGGQGIIIVVLSLFAAGGGRIGTLYVAEARDERILPNFIRTARFIFRVAATFLVVGTAALFVALLVAGFTPGRAVYHAVLLFFAAFDTGGFAPMQASIAYYHSFAVEVVVMVLLLAGSLSFGLHFALWNADWRQVLRHLETRTLALSSGLLFLVVCFGLVRSGAYDELEPLIRKGFFTLLSSVSSAGAQVNAGETYLTDWGVLAPAAIVAAMAIGGMASSTAGGIKALRVGIAAKTLVHDVRKLLNPESAVVVTTYHVGKRQILRDQTARAATSVLLLFVVTYLAGAMIGLAYGSYDITQTLFESVSAASNIGLSIGVTDPGMPRGLMAVYLVQMWLGRLEFVAVFAMLGYLVSLARGRAST